MVMVMDIFSFMDSDYNRNVSSIINMFYLEETNATTVLLRLINYKNSKKHSYIKNIKRRVMLYVFFNLLWEDVNKHLMLLNQEYSGSGRI